MHKGQVLSEEHKAKLLKANFGRIRTDEEKAKNRIAHLGKVASVETRLKISLGNKGKVRSEESRARYRISNKGRIISEAAKLKIGLANKGKAKARWQDPKYRERTIRNMRLTQQGRSGELSAIAKLKWRDPDFRDRTIKATRLAMQSTSYRQKQSKSSIKRWQNLDYRKRTIENMRKAQQKRSREASIYSKRMWQDDEFKERTLKAQRIGMAIHPNKPETIVSSLLNSLYPGEFKFVGDGEVIIAGKNPDFININGRKQIIEVFGDYWHSKRAGYCGLTEKGRIKLFKQYGFKTLVIWESELKNIEAVTNKITKFHQGALR